MTINNREYVREKGKEGLRQNEKMFLYDRWKRIQTIKFRKWDKSN